MWRIAWRVFQKADDLLKELEIPCTCDSLRPTLGIEFIQDMPDMGFDGIKTDEQSIGNLLVGKSFGHEAQDLHFAFTQDAGGWGG